MASRNHRLIEHSEEALRGRRQKVPVLTVFRLESTNADFWDAIVEAVHRGNMAATSEQKDTARGFVELIKKAKGSTKIYFAVGKDRAGDAAVHVDKKKAKACVAALKVKGVATALASGQITFDEKALTLNCMKDPNESAVRKNFALFFKKSDVSIPGVTESSIVVLGPKDWNSAAEDEGDETVASEEVSTQASTTASEPPPPTPPTPPPTPGTTAPNTALRDALAAAWKQMMPEMTKAMADTRRATVQPLATQFQSLIQAGTFEQAKAVLEQLAAVLKQGTATPPSSEDQKARAAALMTEWNQLKPAMTQAAADPAKRAQMEALAGQFKQEFQGGKLDDAEKTLAGLAELAKSSPKTTSSTTATAAGEQEFQRRWAVAKQVWNASMETIDGQINKVAGQMRASDDPDFKLIADRGLPALTENHKTPVMRALFALDGPPSAARLSAAGKAKAAIAAFRSHVASSKQMKTLDQHSQAAFGVALTLESEIMKGLAALDQALGVLEASPQG